MNEKKYLQTKKFIQTKNLIFEIPEKFYGDQIIVTITGSSFDLVENKENDFIPDSYEIGRKDPGINTPKLPESLEGADLIPVYFKNSCKGLEVSAHEIEHAIKEIAENMIKPKTGKTPKIVVVGHSKGGLIPGFINTKDVGVSISTPFTGTNMATLNPSGYKIPDYIHGKIFSNHGVDKSIAPRK